MRLIVRSVPPVFHYFSKRGVEPGNTFMCALKLNWKQTQVELNQNLKYNIFIKCNPLNKLLLEAKFAFSFISNQNPPSFASRSKIDNFIYVIIVLLLLAKLIDHIVLFLDILLALMDT